jgi:hypothetical protein
MDLKTLIPTVTTDLTKMSLEDLLRMKEELCAQGDESFSHFRKTGKSVTDAGATELLAAVADELKRRAKIANAS